MLDVQNSNIIISVEVPVTANCTNITHSLTHSLTHSITYLMTYSLNYIHSCEQQYWLYNTYIIDCILNVYILQQLTLTATKYFNS